MGGDRKAHRPYQMRRDIEPGVALGELRAPAKESGAPQPPQIAVAQPRRSLGCAAAEVALLQQDHAQAAPSGIARDADAIQPTTDDREIVVRHAKNIAFSSEVDTGWREENASNKGLTGLAHGLHDIAGAADQGCVLADRRRLAEQIALHRVAAFLGEEAELLLGLNALGDNRHFEAVAEIDDGADDRRGLRIAAEIHHEGAVDLDLVERESLQVAERGIARAEIVHRDPPAARLQPPDQCQAAVEILDQHAFGDFNFEP